MFILTYNSPLLRWRHWAFLLWIFYAFHCVTKMFHVASSKGFFKENVLSFWLWKDEIRKCLWCNGGLALDCWWYKWLSISVHYSTTICVAGLAGAFLFQCVWLRHGIRYVIDKIDMQKNCSQHHNRNKFAHFMMQIFGSLIV